MGKAALHNHSDNSFLDGRARPIELASAALANGHDAIALTDHDEVGGQLAFQEACKSVGVKDIKGTEARWVYNVAESKKANTKKATPEEKLRGASSHICLLAEDNKGLSNMWALSSIAYDEDYFYGKPNLTPELMATYSEGLWASDGCGLTRFADYIDAGDEVAARQEWGVLLGIFGDHFYSELHTFSIIDPQTEKEHALNAKMKAMNAAKVRFATEMSVPLVVVNDAHYALKEQWREHRLVWKMNTFKGDQHGDQGQAADWLMNDDEIFYWMVDRHGIARPVIEEALANSAMIADRCHAEIKPHLHMPRLHATDADDVAAFLKACEKGFLIRIADRGLDETAYLDRLEREVGLIIDKGMAGYFNVVADYVMAARDGSYNLFISEDPHPKPTPCLCGPGRGSAGGSLVTYLMGITSLDPIKWDLMFERFINPDRPDFPDIDVDVQKSHRLGIKAYVGKQYGEENVCSIGTRSRSGPKQAIYDIAKAWGIPFAKIKEIAAVVGEVDRSDEVDEEENPEYEPPTWAEVLEEKGGDLQGYARAYPELFKYMDSMVGLARQSGVHAAGIIINTEPLLGNVPTRRKPGGTGTLATQFDMHEIEALGGVKDDLLSNKGLDVLATARDLIYERHGIWLDYDGLGYGIPEDFTGEIITFGDEQYNDPAIYEQIDRGQTAGIFQIHTASGTKYAMRFKPRSLTDIADLAAINRPGVLRVPGLLDHYLRRRHREESVIYDHPLLEPITGPSSSMDTYGILVYQEQLIRCARDIAGFSAGEAEALRKAIGKKLMDKMKAMEPQFISGCLANEEFTLKGGDEAVARKLWSSLLASGKYAFNKSHATGYAMQPCWECWTKHYYFDEFIVACLMVHDDKEKKLRFLRECRQRGRTILPPDINLSAARFSIEEGGIRFGLTDVFGIGDAPVPDIIAHRPYIDMTDYLDRTRKGGGRKKGVVDNLIRIGAFDEIGGEVWGREILLEEVYDRRCADEVAPNKWSGLSLEQRHEIIAEKRARVKLDKDGKAIDEFPPFRPKRGQGWEALVTETEEELVGTFITRDPMAPYAKMIEAECIRHPLDVADQKFSESFVIGGQITKLRTHTQKNNKQMAFLTVTWAGEEFDILAFADTWGRYKEQLTMGAPVACEVFRLPKRGARSGCQLSHVERLDVVVAEMEKNRCPQTA